MDKDHPEVKFGKTWVLLINLGTPDATDFWSIRRYLKEFLSDRRVIDINPVFWKLLLNLVILTVRPSIAGKAYKEIWVEESDESPLRLHTRNQSEFLQRMMDEKEENLVVDWAMRRQLAFKLNVSHQKSWLVERHNALIRSALQRAEVQASND